jgi:hypothetical protein
LFKNKGLTQRKVGQISLRCLGIEKGTSFDLWAKHGGRVAFPKKILKIDNLIPENYNYMFVEPGVDQEYRYISRVPENIAYVLVHSQFSYGPLAPHSAEKVLKVEVSR